MKKTVVKKAVVKKEITKVDTDSDPKTLPKRTYKAIVIILFLTH